MANSIRGRFLWHELVTTDTKSAAAFYTRLVGWTTQAWDQAASYTMWMTPGGPMGGLMDLSAEQKAGGAPASWLCYVGTHDVDATVRDAVRLGGRILKEGTDIPNVGRFAVLADPQGAVFAPYTPATMPQADPGAPDQVGDFSWHELMTTDHEAAFRFYHELFGWEKTSSMDMGEGGVYQMYGFKEKPLGGMFNKPKEMPAPPNWLPYIHVHDAKKLAEQVTKLGGRIANGPMEVPGGDWILQGIDPQGAAFAIHSAKPAAKAAPKPRAAPKRPAPAKKKTTAKKATAKKKATKGKAKAVRGKKKATKPAARPKAKAKNAKKAKKRSSGRGKKR